MASIPPPPASGSPGTPSIGMDPKLAGLLCYAPCCVGLVFSIYVAVAEKSSRWLRFHAFQSLLFTAAAVVVSVVVQILLAIVGSISSSLAFLGSALWLILGLGLLGLQIYLMIKAYNLEEYALPQLGPMARKWA